MNIGKHMTGRGTRRHRVMRAALSVVAGLTAVAASAGFALATQSATPRIDIVGSGLVDCHAVTGEIGFSPATISGGKAVERVSIWFQGTKCSPAIAGAVTKPVPQTVIGSMSFFSAARNNCPQNGRLGAGILNFAYNYPPVPAVMIDPSSALSVSVTRAAVWTLSGKVGWGSYPDPSPSPTFKALLKPNLVGGETCKNGVTSLYISGGALLNV